MPIAITRPNGSVYRPRKIRAQMLGNEDETTGVVVLGTHDLADARVRAQAAVSELNNDIDYRFLILPSDPGKRVWYRQKLWGFYEDQPLYGYETDEEHGWAGVEFEVITEFELDDLCLDEFELPDHTDGSKDA